MALCVRKVVSIDRGYIMITNVTNAKYWLQMIRLSLIEITFQAALDLSGRAWAVPSATFVLLHRQVRRHVAFTKERLQTA